MDAAKASVKKVLGRSGQHDTTIHEKVAPAVQHETIEQTQHEHVTPALDREIHQDHYHTSEQPIHDSARLAEKHHHREAEVQHKSFDHDDSDMVKRNLADSQAKYRDQQTIVQGANTQSTEATVAGEHVHHHVYENIQPVVKKQTIEPHVVHTTVPIHEVHHNSSQHHASSALPPVSMEDFKNKGGALQGREERKDFFPGEPKSFGESGSKGAFVMDGHGAKPKDSQYQTLDPKHSHGTDGYTDSHSTHNTSSSRMGGTDPDYSTGNSAAQSTSNAAGGASKSSLMDKLNPKVDANGDGQAGFMK